MSVAQEPSIRTWIAFARTKLDAGTIAKLLLAVFAVWSWINLYRHLDEWQWDFRIYYHAAKADIAGRNPYDPATVAHFAQRRVLGGYAYPPATLAFFKPFTLASFDVARHLFFVFKSLLVIGLVVLWRTRFSSIRTALVLYLACLFAFNNTIYVDLRAGNISLVEQALLWPAFYFFVKDQLGKFCVLVLLASSFKLVPIVFLLLLLTELDRRRVMLLLASLAAFAGFLLISRGVQPELFDGFLENAAKTNTEKIKILNPSSYAFSADLMSSLFGSGEAPADPALGKAMYGGLVLLVLTLTAWAVRRLQRRELPERKELYVFLACFAYALCAPRFKDYSFILLIAPAAYIIDTHARKISALPIVLGLLCLPLVNVPMPGLQSIALIVPDYYPLVLAMLLWGLTLSRVYELGKTPALPCE